MAGAASRAIDFGTAGAAPTFEGIIKGNQTANDSLRDSLRGLATQAKEYGDTVTERNTQELLSVSPYSLA